MSNFEGNISGNARCVQCRGSGLIQRDSFRQASGSVNEDYTYAAASLGRNISRPFP
jgi:hypothetical protein